jgi:hypothetical protein
VTRADRRDIETRVNRTFADKGIDVQAYPWWAWIDVIIDHEWKWLIDQESGKLKWNETSVEEG